VTFVTSTGLPMERKHTAGDRYYVRKGSDVSQDFIPLSVREASPFLQRLWRENDRIGYEDMQELIERERTLQKIAREDFRGPRPESARLAWECLNRTGAA
jgi:hypothetical protein